MNPIIKLVCGAFAASLITFNAQATIIEKDFSSVGDGLLMLDTKTGREWVDVTHTAGLSVNQFLNNSIYSGHGFQVANSFDVFNFFTNAGAGNILYGDNSVFTANNNNAAQLLYSLMEHNNPYSAMGGNPWIHGYIDMGFMSTYTLARIGWGEYFPAGEASFDIESNGMWFDDINHPAVGVWAWRNSTAQSVSEPSSILILLAASAVFLSRRRNNIK